MRLRFGLFAASLLVPVLVSCSRFSDKEPEIPPLTSEPGDPLPDPTTPAGASAPQGYAARVVLYKFLRGVAAGDTRTCAHLARGYEGTIFGKPGGCETGLGQARQRLRPQDIAALSGVTVPAGQPGPTPDEFTVSYADLRWRGDPARPGGVIAARFVLRKEGGRWLIAG